MSDPFNRFADVADEAGPAPEPASPADDAHDAEAADDVEEQPVDDAVAAAESALVEDLGEIARERDEFRALAQRIQADFENYRKRVLRQQTEHLERASEDLVEKLLPVLDACDAALAHGAVDVEPVYSALLGVLEKEGLERVDAAGAPFDPNIHEAVMHEEGETSEPVVAEVFRTGYLFKGRVLRPAMVKVAG